MANSVPRLRRIFQLRARPFHRSWIVIMFAGLLGCVPTEPSSVIKGTSTGDAMYSGSFKKHILEGSEKMPLSEKVGYYRTVPSRSLCEIALSIESEVKPDEHGRATPFMDISDAETGLEANVVRPVYGWDDFQHGRGSNRNVAMKELLSRMVAEISCPILVNYSVRDAKSLGSECAKSLFPERGYFDLGASSAPRSAPIRDVVGEVCRGNFGGKPFATAYVDIVVAREQAEEKVRKRKGVFDAAAPTLKCSSTTTFGTTYTSCY